MAARRPLGHITKEDLDALRREVLDAFPDANDVLVQYTVASEVLINLIGPLWWSRALAGGEADPYFVKDAEDKPSRFLHQHRVLSLAAHLLECQSLEGYDAMVSYLRSRSLLGAANELAAAHNFLRSGHRVQFVERSGVLGQDFDFLVDGSVAVEVKAKEDLARYSRTSLDGIVSKARRQLPKSGPSVVVLRIPDSWATNPAFAGEAESVFASRLRNSRRVNAIVVLWEQWIPSTPPGKMLCAVRFRTFVNPRPRRPIRDIDRLVIGFSHVIADAAASTAASPTDPQE